MTLTIPDHIVWQNVPGDIALFDTERGLYHALNGSAAAIWRMVAAGVDEVAIVAGLAETHGAPLDDVAGDVAAFVRDALVKGLLVRGAA